MGGGMALVKYLRPVILVLYGVIVVIRIPRPILVLRPIIGPPVDLVVGKIISRPGAFQHNRTLPLFPMMARMGNLPMKAFPLTSAGTGPRMSDLALDLALIGLIEALNDRFGCHLLYRLQAAVNLLQSSCLQRHLIRFHEAINTGDNSPRMSTSAGLGSPTRIAIAGIEVEEHISV